MKLTELRLGNWVKIFDVETQIEGICLESWGDVVQNSNFSERGIEDFEPIPLTEEWLSNFGFEKNKENDVWKLAVNIPGETGDFHIDLFGQEANMSGCYVSSGMISSGSIKYVHQLQNLYFALTGEELKIKIS